MKIVSCSYINCGLRRPHWTRPDEYRGSNLIETEDNFEGEIYCSFTCAILAGKMSVKVREEQNDCQQKSPSYDRDSSRLEPIETDSEEEKVQGHHRFCNWHWDWHSCNCGAFDKRGICE
jgi:hypothetical protein